MSSGGARPNAGRKKKDTELIYMRVPSAVAEEIRNYAKEHKVTLAEAVAEVFAKTPRN